MQRNIWALVGDSDREQLPFKITGFVRLEALVGPRGIFPISRSTWWNKVRSGEFPQPVKLGPRTTAWRVKDILELIERFEGKDEARG
ncbi:AlpA family phage regulatory protein [Rhizobium sp. CB3060]|uniref:helix-turn-helix transcriptional regulator n=1 Tax=Rhizobium sp. CB3060 TaxID=3138255 RepID=UPI0021A5AE97|nr:AlpA family phage regulatory protein [Rhizobium tropici]UWU20922.1 AlpA family phage regulatory protein [Rhizobium tropici]